MIYIFSIISKKGVPIFRISFSINIMPDEYFEILSISFIHIKKIKLMMEKVISKHVINE